MSTDAISPLRQRMIEDMSARKLNPHTQRIHISSCKRFAAYLKRSPDTAIRRFLMHVLPKGFHRIRHSGLLANGSRADNVARARALLNVPKPDAIPDDPKSADAAEPPTLSRPCPCCGGRMLIIETFARGCEPRYRPATAPLAIRIDTS